MSSSPGFDCVFDRLPRIILPAIAAFFAHDAIVDAFSFGPMGARATAGALVLAVLCVAYATWSRPTPSERARTEAAAKTIAVPADPLGALIEAVRGQDAQHVAAYAPHIPVPNGMDGEAIGQDIVLGFGGDMNAVLRTKRALAPRQMLQITEEQEGVYDADAWQVSMDWAFTPINARHADLHQAVLLAVLRTYARTRTA